MNLEQRIQAGLDGHYQGLSNGFTRINDYIFGIQRGTYYLLGGQSGTFKTTLVDYMVLNALQYAEANNIPIEIFYYSFEIDRLTKQCNWLSNIIYQKYGRTISPETIKGLGNFRLTPEEHELVKSETPEMERLFDKIYFTFKTENPTGIFNTLKEHAVLNGTIEYEEYTYQGEIKQKFKKYRPNQEGIYRLIIIDHLYLLKKERGYQTKEVIDKMSEYAVSLRNMYGYTPIFIQQFNQGLSSIDRLKFKGADLSPQQSDFRDSTSPYADADVVLGTMSPFKLDIETSLGYDIRRLKGKMLMCKIIKNRLSTDNIAIGLYVNPKAASFSELPLPNVINYRQYE